MSELEKQLISIRNNTIQSISLYSNTPSLFFTNKEAGLIDIDNIYESALNSLQILIQYDIRFNQFLNNILHLSSKNIQRDLLTLQENKDLDLKLEELFQLLALYSNEPDSHKVLEYLIRRYRVHELNSDGLLRCMISQHDTKIFARVVQLTTITSSVWSFLEPYKTSGTPLPRIVLAKRCTKDNMLLNKISSVVLSAIQLGSTSTYLTKTTLTRINNIISFFTATILDFIEDTQNISDQQLRSLFTYIIGGITGKLPTSSNSSSSTLSIETNSVGIHQNILNSWQQSSCLIISQISRYVELSQVLLNTLFNSMAKSIRSKIDVNQSGNISEISEDIISTELYENSIENILMAIIVIMQHQQVKLSLNFLKYLFVDENPPFNTSFIIFNYLSNLHFKYNADISPVFSGLLDSIVTNLLSQTLILNENQVTNNQKKNKKNKNKNQEQEQQEQVQEQQEEEIKENKESNNENIDYYFEIYQKLISTFNIDVTIIMYSLEKMLKLYITSDVNLLESKNSQDKNILEIITKILKFISQRYSLELDITIKKLTEQLSSTINGTNNQVGETEEYVVKHKKEENETNKLKLLLNYTFQQSLHHTIQDNGIGLFLSLNHPSDIIRKEGLQLFSKIFGVTNGNQAEYDINAEDIKGLARTIINILNNDNNRDDIIEILLNVNVLYPLIKILDDQIVIILDKIIDIVSTLKNKLEYNSSTTHLIVAFLTNVFSTTLLQQIFSTLQSDKNLILHKLFSLLLFTLSILNNNNNNNNNNNVNNNDSSNNNLNNDDNDGNSNKIKKNHVTKFEIIFDNFVIALDNFSQYHPLLIPVSNKSISNKNKNENKNNKSYETGIQLIKDRIHNNLITKHEKNLSFIQELAFVIYKTQFIQSNLDSFISQHWYENCIVSLLDILINLSQEIISSKQNQQKNEILTVILTLIFSQINLNYSIKLNKPNIKNINNYNIINNRFYNQINLILLKSFQIWKQLQLYNNSNNKKGKNSNQQNFEKYFEGYLNKIPFHSLGPRLLSNLLELLNSSTLQNNNNNNNIEISIPNLLRLCLETFFTSDYLSILISFATNNDFTSNSTKFPTILVKNQLDEINEDDENFIQTWYNEQMVWSPLNEKLIEDYQLFTLLVNSNGNNNMNNNNDTIKVNLNIQISALCVLSSYLAQLPTISNSIILTLFPLFLTNLQHLNIEIQQATIDLFENFVRSLNNNNNNNNSSTNTSFTVEKIKIPIESIIQYYRQVSNQLSIIQYDSKNILYTLQSQFFSFNDLVLFSSNIIKLFSWKVPHLTSSLVLISTYKQSYDNVWVIGKYLFDNLNDYNSNISSSYGLLVHNLITSCNNSLQNSKVELKKNDKIFNIIEYYIKFISDKSEKSLISLIRFEILTSLSNKKISLELLDESSKQQHKQQELNGNIVVNNREKNNLWINQVDIKNREVLFEGLIQQLERNLNEDFMTPLCSINVSIELGYKYLKQSSENIQKLFDKHQIVNESYSSLTSSLDNVSLPILSQETSTSSNNNLTSKSSKKSQLNTNKILSKNLTFPLQQLSWTLDILSIIYHQNIENSDIKIISSSCCILFDLLNLLNTNQISKILSINYVRSIILELLLHSLKLIGFNQFKEINQAVATSSTTVTTTPGKSKKSKQNNNNNNNNNEIEYSINRVSNDIMIIFKCLELSSSIYLHKYSLEVLHILLTACPSHLQSTIKLLTKILSSNILSENLSPENTNNLVSNILQLLIQITDESSNENLKYPQIVLEPYFHTYQTIPFERKLSLLNIITSQYDPTITPICISLILSHAFVSHSSINDNEIQESKNHNDEEKKLLINGNNVNSDNSNSNNDKEVYILLSRSAQRKMNQIRRTSQSEEFFNMASQLHLQLSDPSNQIHTLISLTNIVRKLFSISLKYDNDDIDIDVVDESDDKVSIEFSGSKSYQFLTKQYVNYTNSFFLNEKEDNSNNNNNNNLFNNNIPALIILQLEYILEFIENPLFHDSLLTLLFNNESGILTSFGYTIQQIFLLFSESLLELLSYLNYLQHGYLHKKIKTRHFTIQLNHQKVNISSKEFLKYSSTLCLNILQSYQHLLDGPTFIVILQELLAHENLSVRQKSLEILSDRLQKLGKIRAKLDDGLYVDLSNRLRSTVSSCFNNNGNSNSILDHKLVGVSQSALLCIDILARQFSKNKEWIKPMSQYLSELIKIIEKLSQHIYTDTKTSLNDKDEELKLLGSALLCCGTLSSVSKTKTLPYLPSIINEILKSIEFSQEKVQSYQVENMTKEIITSMKSYVLLIRSSVSTLSTITIELAPFFHPYISRVLLTLFPLLSVSNIFPDSFTLVDDVENYLATLRKSIPKRLSIPALVQVTPTLYSKGNNVSYHYAIYLTRFWSTLERTDVTNHLTSLQTICQHGFEYRELYEGKKQYEQKDLNSNIYDVDTEICQGIIEICLKYTEHELKDYLIRLHQWTEENILPESNDESVDDEINHSNDWFLYCRSKIFFQFISLIEAKLQSIFVPLMGLVWVFANEQLQKYIQFVQQNKQYLDYNNDNSLIEVKKSKKRKRKDDDNNDNNNSDNNNTNKLVTKSNTQYSSYQFIRNELHEISNWVLESVRLCCVYDNVHFIDQLQYEIVMPNISSLLFLYESFNSNDVEYSNYALNKVLPCIIQLVISVGKDILWKPLNHKILQMTRNKKKIIRIISLKSLQKLFVEVGEEYLLLLPECLSYLSELLEDDSSEVVSLASEVIQNIEELSGESLDSYLR